jgi:threonine aldolase
VICHEHAHLRLYEGGGPAVLSGCLLHPLAGARGVFTGAQVAAAVRPDAPHFARTRLVCVENTHNAMGGCAWRRDEIAGVVAAARDHGLAPPPRRVPFAERRPRRRRRSRGGGWRRRSTP